MRLITTVQIGKNGISESLLNTIENNFKTHQNVKVVFLKNFSRDRKKIKEGAEEIVAHLGKNYSYRVLGFTVFIKKWRKAQR
ncbi:YhbY family RNA-binding protein [Candidatus Pacearchaeota archaeon]|nr:YhbY family RNA-binding protein [Candidatus Pacearchaeota archaeon]